MTMDRRRRDPAWVDARAERRAQRIAYYLTRVDDEAAFDDVLPAHVEHRRCVRTPPVWLTWCCVNPLCHE